MSEKVNQHILLSGIFDELLTTDESSSSSSDSSSNSSNSESSDSDGDSFIQIFHAAAQLFPEEGIKVKPGKRATFIEEVHGYSDKEVNKKYNFSIIFFLNHHTLIYEQFRSHFRISRTTSTELINDFERSAFCPVNLRSHGGLIRITAEEHILSFMW